MYVVQNYSLRKIASEEVGPELGKVFCIPCPKKSLGNKMYVEKYYSIRKIASEKVGSELGKVFCNPCPDLLCRSQS